MIWFLLFPTLTKRFVSHLYDTIENVFKVVPENRVYQLFWSAVHSIQRGLLWKRLNNFEKIIGLLCFLKVLQLFDFIVCCDIELAYFFIHWYFLYIRKLLNETHILVNFSSFNDFFVADSEFIYKDEHGGVTLFNADNLTTTTVLSNYTFVSKLSLFYRFVSHLIKPLIIINNETINIL